MSARYVWTTEGGLLQGTHVSLFDKIAHCNSLSVVGLAKNTGKTVTLNYLLQELRHSRRTVAVTSIGIDGEGIDQVTRTAKPEIILYEPMLFVTSEQHYARRRLTAEILDVSTMRTALGRLVTARVHNTGKVLLSGPADTATLRRVIARNAELGANLTIVDGALSRLSPASPSVTEAMILATGAAVSANMQQLIRQTKFVCDLVSLPCLPDDALRESLSSIAKGVWQIDGAEIHDLKLNSALSIGRKGQNAIPPDANTLFVAGVITNKLLEHLRLQKNIAELTVIARDFTKIFVSPESYNAFIKRGGTLQVLYRTQLLAVTVNPTSPQGYTLDSTTLCNALSEVIGLPVMDVRQHMQ